MRKESWVRAIDEGRPWTDEEAAQAVAACDASGMVIAEFARQYNASSTKFYWWRKKLSARGESRARLFPVRVAAEGGNVPEASAPRVVVSDGRLRLEVEGISPEWVASLIRLLQESER